MTKSGSANQDQATERVTLREFFKVLLNNTYPSDLKSPKLVGIMSHVLNLTHNQVRKALHDLEKRKFIEVTSEDCEVLRVEVLDRNWTKAPKIVL